jgi:hypothetical protein
LFIAPSFAGNKMPIGMELASRAGFAAVLANERARAAARLFADDGICVLLFLSISSIAQ